MKTQVNDVISQKHAILHKVVTPTTPTPESIGKEKAGQGKKEYISLLRGNKLTLRQATKAKCYECMGYYADGVGDCGDPFCPLHAFMPYAIKKQKKESNRPKRVLTPEQLKKMQEGRKKSRGE